MKGYGFKGGMNPQTKQKGEMSPSKGKSDGKGSAKRDMSPVVKEPKEQAVWQNMPK